MKTDDLIKAMAADQTPSGHDLSTLALVLAGSGFLIAMASLVASLGIRPDLGIMLLDWHFVLKLLMVSSLLVSALRAATLLARPGGEERFGPGLFVLPMLVFSLGILSELLSLPMGEWGEEMMGENAALCLTTIPLLSLLPFAVMLLLLRQGATTRPMLAGGLVGLVAGGIGALAYATHCTDDSPFFVATWYSLAICLPVVAGILIAPRVSSW